MASLVLQGALEGRNAHGFVTSYLQTSCHQHESKMAVWGHSKVAMAKSYTHSGDGRRSLQSGPVKTAPIVLMLPIIVDMCILYMCIYNMVQHAKTKRWQL